MSVEAHREVPNVEALVPRASSVLADAIEATKALSSLESRALREESYSTSRQDTRSRRWPWVSSFGGITIPPRARSASSPISQGEV